MAEIKLKIDHCNDCPRMKEQRVYTDDAFETVFDWFCGAAGDRKIGQVETFDPLPAVPSWCPLSGDVKSIEGENP